MYELHKNAIVTGSARGIGKAIAMKLAKEGLNIVVSDIMHDEAKQTARELEDFGIKAIAIKTDISKVEDVENLIRISINELV